MTSGDDIPGMGSCPSPEQLAAFVDDRLNARDRASVERHLADCERCRPAFASVIELREAESHSVRRFLSSIRRRPFAAGAAVAVLAASLLVVVRMPPGSVLGGDAAIYRSFADALGRERVVEGRLTGFPYQPLHAPTRSAEDLGQDLGMRAHLARARDAVTQSRSAANLHRLGVASLILGNVDDAIGALDDARKLDPNNAGLDNDLATAFLVKAKASGREDEAEQAREAAERALAADPRMAAARFNHALALEALKRSDTTRQAWRDFIALEPDGPWAAEARAHLERDDGVPASPATDPRRP